MSKFKRNFIIPYYETDKNKFLKPISLLNLLNETAFEHSNSVIEMDKLKELNFAWMLNRWKIKIDKYPKAEEKISIETWTSNIDRFYVNREFFVLNENNEIMVKASTIWILVDINKKRPIKIPKELQFAYKIVDERAFYDFYDFKEKINIEYIIDFHVRRNDIDYNNHVNNAIYLGWMFEAVPKEIYDNYVLREFEILYKKEIKYGSTILSGVKEISKDNRKVFYHDIMNKATKVNHAMGITIWEK